MGLLKVVSWDGHTFAASDYTATLVTSTGLPALEPQYAERYQATAVITGVKLTQYQLSPLQILIENAANQDALRLNLHRWFDNKDAVPRRLVVEDIGGGNQRYVEGVCLGLVQVASQGGLGYSAIIALDGDYDPHYRFRAVTPVTEPWAVTGTFQTKSITNAGHDEAYPIIRFTPTSAKSSGSYALKRWVPIVWRSPKGVTNYPIDITNGGIDANTLISAGKVTINGSNLRVEVNGVDVPRFFHNSIFNTSATKIWVSMSFTGVRHTTLNAQMLSGATVTQIQCASSISSFPQSGTLLINNEGFIYSGKSNELQTFLGVTRAANNTTAATHSGGASVYLVENEVWIKYHNPVPPTYVYVDAQEPIFELDVSTNGSWRYLEFGQQGMTRPGSWAATLANNARVYTGDDGANYPLYTAYGLARYVWDYAAAGRVYATNPCGITRFQVHDGEAYKEPGFGSIEYLDPTRYVGAVDDYGDLIQETAVVNTLQNTWQAWTRDLNSLADVYEVYLELRPNSAGNGLGFVKFAVSDVTLTLNSNQTPLVTLGVEAPNYTLAATITNLYTNDVFSVNFSMEPNATLEVNTDTKEVRYLKNGTSQFNALSRPLSAGAIWMRLLPGAQTLRFEDVGTTGIAIEIEYQKRYYY